MSVCVLRHVRLLVTPWTVARKTPLSMEFSRKRHWSGLPFPLPGDSPNPGIEHISCLPCTGRQFVYHCATWEGSLKTGIQILLQLILQLQIDQEDIKIVSVSHLTQPRPGPTAQPQPWGMVDGDTIDLFNPQVCTQHQLYATHLSRQGWSFREDDFNDQKVFLFVVLEWNR